MSSDPPSAGHSAGAEPAEALLEALGRHSQSARSHAESTATYAFATAAQLGLSRGECELVREAARLHEVGQLYAGAAPQLGAHQEATYRLVRGAGIDEQLCRWLLRTRERFDGAGPEGLVGAEVPIQSRLIRAACTFHATVVEPAPSSDAAPHVRGVESLRSQAGAELDPDVVGALIAVVERALV